MVSLLLAACGDDDGVGPNEPVATVTVTPPSSMIGPGERVQLEATAKDAHGATLAGRSISWSSSNTAVASVSPTGVVTGVAVGSTTITATSEGRSGTGAITVAVLGQVCPDSCLR